MNGRETNERIEDLIEGLLSPVEELRVRELIGADPEWAAQYRGAAALHELLAVSVDVDPPADLAASVLKSVTTDRARRALGVNLPAALEKTLVLAGSAALAGLVVLGTTALQTGAGGWVGRLVVATANGLTAAAGTLAGSVASVTHWDWVVSLAATLSGAARTVLTSSAGPLLALGLVAVVLTTGLAWLLIRSEKGIRGGGLGHAHLAW